jgi:hypothetical protein
MTLLWFRRIDVATTEVHRIPLADGRYHFADAHGPVIDVSADEASRLVAMAPDDYRLVDDADEDLDEAEA